MTPEEQLKEIILKKYKSIRAFALENGLPYSTINNIFERGVGNIGITTAIKICELLHIDPDALGRGQIKPRSLSVSEPLSPFEYTHIRKYRTLDGYGKKAVDTVMEVEYERCTAAQPVESDEEEGNIIELDFPYQAASAGVGDYADDTAHEKLAVRLNENTRRADYLMRVNGDSMEPKYQDGDVLLVHSQPSVEEGEVGIFIINGDRLVKQQGAGELISLNPQYPNIPISETDSVYCKGKVIGVLSPEDML